MNVQEFIHEALLQIATAIHEANQSFEKQEISAAANPPGAVLESQGGRTYQSVSDTQAIEFDIAVAVVESNEASHSKKAGVAISVVSGALDGSKSSHMSSSNVSRLKFSVPLKLPRP